MYFDPISAWLVTLLFDGALIIGEKTKGGTIDEYHKEQIKQANRSLNCNIRGVKAKCELDLPEHALKNIRLHIRIAKNSFSFQQGHGNIIIDTDNQDYIIALLEKCVKIYDEYEKKCLDIPIAAEKYRSKAESYKKVMANVRQLKEKQDREKEEADIRKVNTTENENSNMILFILAILVIFIAILAIIL